MDSHLPNVVYKLERQEKGGSNADDIREILDDIDLQIYFPREPTSLDWRGEEQVIKINPDLIIIHGSAFYDQTHLEDSEKKFLSFLRYMVDEIEAKFLIYSRGFCELGEDYWRGYYEEETGLKNRIEIFLVCPSDSWDNNKLQRDLKSKVESMLNE